VAVLLSVAPGAAMAAGPGGLKQAIEFTFEQTEQVVPRYAVYLDDKGVGSYREGSAAEGQKLQVSAATVKTIFAARHTIQTGHCETKFKGIASTGKKTLRSFDNDEASECVLNYSDDRKVNAAVDAFMAIAETMQEGEKLAHEHRFDRLGLDAEMDFLVDEVKNDHAKEVQNIAPVLQSIVADDAVMERVRRKAQGLLDQFVDAAPLSAR